MHFPKIKKSYFHLNPNIFRISARRTRYFQMMFLDQGSLVLFTVVFTGNNHLYRFKGRLLVYGGVTGNNHLYRIKGRLLVYGGVTGNNHLYIIECRLFLRWCSQVIFIYTELKVVFLFTVVSTGNHHLYIIKCRLLVYVGVHG